LQKTDLTFFLHKYEQSVGKHFKHLSSEVMWNRNRMSKNFQSSSKP